MQQGKHTEYEKALHDEMLSSLSQQPASPEPELEGGVADSEWAESQWGSAPARVGGPAPDHWGGAGDPGGSEWGEREETGETGAWPDLGNYNNKGRFISKEETDKSKSKR